MKHVEILSIVQLPPKYCIICNLLVSDGQALRRHYEEHRLKFLANIDGNVENILDETPADGHQLQDTFSENIDILTYPIIEDGILTGISDESNVAPVYDSFQLEMEEYRNIEDANGETLLQESLPSDQFQLVEADSADSIGLSTCPNIEYLEDVSKETPPSDLSKLAVKYTCHICNKSFTAQSSRNRHVKRQHEKVTRIDCALCELSFSNLYNLRAHQKSVHFSAFVKVGNIIKCPQCRLTYKTEASLIKHILSKHKKEKSPNLLSPSAAGLESHDYDPQSLAENVLNELKQLQSAIGYTDPAEEFQTTIQTNTEIDEAVVDEVTIKDRINPSRKVTAIYKVQRIKRGKQYYYICEYCSKEIPKVNGYIRHRRIHTKYRPYICVLCKKSFTTQNELKRHCLTHNLEFKQAGYRCPKCDKRFSYTTQFDRHLSIHAPGTVITFECQKCPKTFNSLKKYLRHSHENCDPELKMLKMLLPEPLCILNGKVSTCFLKDHEDLQQVFKCSICGLKLKTLMSLTQHEKRHTNLAKYRCRICEGFYPSKSSLKVHTKTHLSNGHLKCHQCPKIFRRRYELERHELAVHRNGATKYKCRYCDKHFQTKQNCRCHMMTHLKQLIGESNKMNNNNGIESIPAIIETNITTNSEKIKSEMKIPVKIKKSIQKETAPEWQHCCTICWRKFQYKCRLKRHILESHNNNVQTFKCEICLKDFKRNKELQKHLLTHQQQGEGEVNKYVAVTTQVMCQVCGKHYANKKSLNVHLRIHTNLFPFKCDFELCKQSYRTSGHLQAHQKTKQHFL
ncbi:uncharacterized protein isoform X2 [Musca autumnalis]|uniref:uncharacterized protein isoform X2 n=1 Tax=Musca autumnalis TaxID=221902 RepID=UPI003CF689A8